MSRIKKIAIGAPPEWLNVLAKEEWGRVVASGFVAQGPTDESVLAAYCQNFARWIAAECLLEQFGTEIVLRDDKGNVKSVSVSPQVGISNKALDRMLKAAAQLGVRANVNGSKPAALPAGKTAGTAAAAADWFN